MKKTATFKKKRELNTNKMRIKIQKERSRFSALLASTIVGQSFTNAQVPNVA